MIVSFFFLFFIQLFKLIYTLNNPDKYVNEICDNSKTYYYNSSTVISYGIKGFCLITLGSEPVDYYSNGNFHSYNSITFDNSYLITGDKQNTYLTFAKYIQEPPTAPYTFYFIIYNKETNTVKINITNEDLFDGKMVKIFNLASKNNINYIAFTYEHYINIYKYNISNRLLYNQIEISDVSTDTIKTLDCIGLIENNLICIFTHSSSNECYLQLINESTLTGKYNRINVPKCINSNGQKLYEIDNLNYYVCYFSNDVDIFCLVGSVSSTHISVTTEDYLILRGCDSNMKNFDKGKLFDIDILACTNSIFIYMQSFYYTGTDTKVIKLAGDLITIKDSKEFSLPSIVQITSSVSILTAKQQDLQGIYIYFIIKITCNDYLITCYKNSKCTLDLENYINNFNYPDPNINILFENIPSTGTLYLFNTNSQIVIDIKYNSYKYDYISNTITSTEFTYYVINNLELKSTICKGTIKVESCYVSCNSCSGKGTNSNHKCITCNNNYYFLQSSNNCYNSETKPSNTYLSEYNDYRTCHISCATCSGYGDSKCLSCNIGNGYSFFLNLNIYKCINYQPTGYYLLKSNNTYMKCYKSCYECLTSGTESENNCESCDNSTYYQIEGTKNCVEQAPEGYGLISNVFKKCTLSTCKKCNNDLGKCTECKDNFYPKNDVTDGVCYDQTSIEKNYYLDITTKEYKRCASECETCFGDSNTKCYSCSTGNYLLNKKCSATCDSGYAFEFTRKCLESCPIYTFKDESAKKCVNCKNNNDGNIYLKDRICSASLEDGYFLANPNYNVLDKCYESCFKCTKSGNSKKHNCDVCKTNYYKLEDDTTMCFKSDAIIEGYKFESVMFKKCYNSCKTCSDINGIESDNKCISCKTNYEKDPYISTNCVLKCKKYWFKNTTSQLKECVDSCPSSYPYLFSNNNECSSSCSSCSNCSNIQFYKYNNNCVTSCPENSILDKILYTCYNLYNLPELFKYVGNYIAYQNKPPNVIIKSETMIFHLCNTTSAGKSDCDTVSNEEGSSIIDLSNCLSIIKKQYSYKNNDYFYIGLLDVFREDTEASQFEYIIFDKIGRTIDNNLCNQEELSISKKLNISDSKIDYASDVYKEFGYDIINYKDNKFYKKIGNSFYTNINNNKRDVLLNDRYKDIYIGLNKVCENFCTEYNFDIKSERVQCKCKTKDNFKNLVYETFIELKKSEQLYYDKEFQYFYNKENVFNKKIFLEKNFGNYFLLSFSSISLICLLLFVFKQNSIFEHLNNFLKYLKNLNEEIDRINNELKQDKNIYQTNYNNGDIYGSEQHFITNNKSNPPKKYFNQYNTNNNNNNEKNIGKEYAKTYILNNNYLNESQNQNSYNFFIKKKIDISMDQDFLNTKNYNYIKFNKEKKYLTNYFSLDLYLFTIKNRIKIINLITSHNKYDVFSYKLSFLLLTYSFDFFFATFFYLNNFIHTLYIKNKKSVWYNEICIGFFSAISCYIIIRFIEYLIEFETEFKEFDDKKEEIDQAENVGIELGKLTKFIGHLKCKFIIYFIFLFVCLFFIWYFVTSFCITYPNTQFSWGMSVLYNIIISFIFPFGFYGIGILIQSHAMNKNKYCLFKFSKFMLKL